MVRTRFAPSPTGYLHIGGVRTALFNWLVARAAGGQFILRIDDTDAERNVDAALRPILDGFRWLGLDWDEGPEVGGTCGPYFQSQRLDRYHEAVRRLLDSGCAYRDYATADEIQAERAAAEKEKRPFRYSRRWMAEDDAQAAAFEAEGRAGVVRLRMPADGQCRFTDRVRGEVVVQWNQEQDHVIQRADGSCLYHLATVVDDHDFGITHVIRAVEHLSNTPRQIFIFESLGYPLPEFAHLPYIAEPGSSNKISKRKLDKYLKNPDFKKLNDHGRDIIARMGRTPDPDLFNPVIVDFYREVGYLPAALLNYLVLLGWSLDDKTQWFTTDEMIRLFSLDRVNKSPASFDPQKLWAFQQHYMQTLPIKQTVARVLPYLQQAGWVADPPPCDTAPRLTAILEAAGDRIKTAGDILDYPEFFAGDAALALDPGAVAKRLDKPGARRLLADFAVVLAGVEPFDRARCEAALKAFVADREIQIGDIIHALRVALTGKAVGVGMFETLEILGRDSCLARIARVAPADAM